jgi:hypothetical protein
MILCVVKASRRPLGNSAPANRLPIKPIRGSSSSSNPQRGHGSNSGLNSESLQSMSNGAHDPTPHAGSITAMEGGRLSDMFPGESSDSDLAKSANQKLPLRPLVKPCPLEHPPAPANATLSNSSPSPPKNSSSPQRNEVVGRVFPGDEQHYMIISVDNNGVPLVRPASAVQAPHSGHQEHTLTTQVTLEGHVYEGHLIPPASALLQFPWPTV